jgi:prephenate dehydrogenase
MNVTIIGLGLIGGSMAIALKEQGMATHIIGVDNSIDHINKAKELGLIDSTDFLDNAVKRSELIIITTPVSAIPAIVNKVLDNVSSQIVIDMGSTKKEVINAVESHKNRKRFVATHPMWGTEFSGPEAAVSGAFRNKATVICNGSDSDADAVETVTKIFKTLGMHLIEMNADEHDLHVAYISHISHITSFALANTVLEKEKEEDAIFELASAGFESTVRLAKSSPEMWVPIFKQNRENVLDVLNEHITQLKKFKACLEKENYEYLQELIENANKIKGVLDSKRG